MLYGVWFVLACDYVCLCVRLCDYVFVCERWYGMLLFVLCCFLLELVVCVACDIECVVVWGGLLCFVVFACALRFNKCGCVFGL